MKWLDDVKVIDLSQYIPGPFATRQLADLGANVIKVEPPSGDPMRRFMSAKDDDASAVYRHINRGKRICRLDLKLEDDRSVLQGLLKYADVLLESYRPGVLERLGLSRTRLQKINPGLIHCALSGYGQTGPYYQRAGHDINYMASSGMLAVNGTADNPVSNYPPLADHAGAMQASTAILAALYGRSKSGEGAFLDISLFESALAWNYLPILTDSHGRAENILNGGAACYNVYQSLDNEFVSLGAIEPHFWQRFCEAVKQPQWISRQQDALPQAALIAELKEMFSSKAIGHWNELLDAVDCCYQPVLEAPDLFHHPHIQARKSVNKSGPEYAAVINDDKPTINIDFVEISDAQPLHW
ncbi:MAG: CoA transferase [Gammaproteobacteria bacterium]|nr:CoA transferase [Gammaproteobacteria bacterium]